MFAVFKRLCIRVFLCGAPFKGTPHYARRIHLSCESKSFCK